MLHFLGSVPALTTARASTLRQHETEAQISPVVRARIVLVGFKSARSQFPFVWGATPQKVGPPVIWERRFSGSFLKNSFFFFFF